MTHITLRHTFDSTPEANPLIEIYSQDRHLMTVMLQPGVRNADIEAVALHALSIPLPPQMLYRSISAEIASVLRLCRKRQICPDTLGDLLENALSLHDRNAQLETLLMDSLKNIQNLFRLLLSMTPPASSGGKQDE